MSILGFYLTCSVTSPRAVVQHLRQAENRSVKKSEHSNCVTGTILHCGCEQFQSLQCLTEIMAVHIGTFVRQMAEKGTIYLLGEFS